MSDKKKRAIVYLEYECSETEKVVTSCKWWFVCRAVRIESTCVFGTLGECVNAAKRWCDRNGYEVDFYG